ncbi:MAG TPA: SWIM zinc finger family protein, partial [Gemmatimonadaceae bacterium]
MLRCTVREAGHWISALVSGSEIAPYEVHVEISHPSRAGDVSIDGDCSCPMEVDCKHVVAALTAAITLRGRQHASNGVPSDVDPTLTLWLSDLDRVLRPPDLAPESLLYFASTRAYTRALRI